MLYYPSFEFSTKPRFYVGCLTLGTPGLRPTKDCTRETKVQRLAHSRRLCRREKIPGLDDSTTSDFVSD